MLQYLIVGLIVMWAAWIAAMRLLPRTWRLAVRQRIAGLARVAGCGSLAQWLGASAGTTACGGCGSCDSKPVKVPTDIVVGSISADALRRTLRR